MGTFSQDRTPGAETRARRNSQAWQAGSTVIVAPNGGIVVNGDGSLSIDLGDGVQVVTGELTLDLGDGLAFNTGSLVIDLATDPGLEFSGGDLQAKIKTNGGVTRDSDGLSIAAADESNRGGVLRQVNIADIGVLTDNSGGTSGSGTVGSVGVTVTDPADAPADADTLRDDLVANTIPSIETELSNLRDAVATLAEYATSLEDKVNAMLASQITAEQMSTP